ncbi:UDP-transferase protein [Colletotrichum tofieldiae]|nr:UDP-transferase protein [Colletotrichum tofieldiae]
MKSVINDVRVNLMGLEPMSPGWWLSQYNRMGVPCTYLWSPLLLPKPADWPDNVNVSGFVFNDAPEEYAPPAELVRFLEAAETPPVYIGFGSMSFANAQEVFEGIFEAVRRVGVRAVVGKGWANLDKEEVGKGAATGMGGGTCRTYGRGVPRRQRDHGDGAPEREAHARGSRCRGPAVLGTRVFAAGCGPEAGFGIAELTGEKFEERLRELLKPEYAVAAEKFAEVMKMERPGEEGCVDQVVETLRVYEREGSGRAEVVCRSGACSCRKWEGQEGELRALDLVKWPDLVSPGDPVTGLALGIGRAFGSVVEDGKGGHWGKLGLHVLRAPLTILAAVTFGLFNFLDFVLYKLASPFEPKLYASNPRLYTYTQMLRFLVSAPIIELSSIITRPPIIARKERSIPRVVLEIPLAVIRTLLALLNVIAGFVGITLRHLEIASARAMGERPRRDVVAEARVKQGRVEAEELRIEGAETGRDLVGDIVRRWDEKKRA